MAIDPAVSVTTRMRHVLPQMFYNQEYFETMVFLVWNMYDVSIVDFEQKVSSFGLPEIVFQAASILLTVIVLLVGRWIGEEDWW